MKTQNLNLSSITGMIMMSIPALFFFSVVMEQFFNNNFLIENIFVPIDKTSGLLSAFLMIGLPFIAVCINLIPLINLKIKKENNTLRLSFDIKTRVLNIVIICLGIITMAIILGYLFTENFKLR
ncbi:MAG: hypothetical protein ABI550_07775 [Ignavibacteriaceae bacterium]